MRRLALVALLAVASGARADTFDDGVFTADAIAPVAGYFVPQATLRDSYAIPPADVIAASRAMTLEELSAYARGGADLLVAKEFALFVYPTQGLQAFLWTGRHDGQQQVIAAAWNGQLWDSGGHSDGRADAYELVFASPAVAAQVHVLVFQQSGTEGHDAIRTERVCLAPFPGTAGILDRGLATADVVVSLPGRTPREAATAFLDCVKGWVDAATFAAIPGADRLTAESVVFLRKDADGRLAIRFSYRPGGGRFEGPHGPLVDPASDGAAYATRLVFRFLLARRHAAVLALAPAAPGDFVLELSIGDDEPLSLFVPAITRSGRDGGEATFRFEVRRDGAVAGIAPIGRLGADSFDAPPDRLEPCDALGFDYRFIRCGPGVVKLLVRPRSRPFRAEVTANVSPVDHASLFERRREEPVRSNTLRIAAD